MSLLERIESGAAEDDAQAGKKLIRIGSNHGMSLSERLGSILHRLTSNIPIPALRFGSQPALKIASVPKDPVAGDKAAGEAIIKGFIVRNGTSIAVDALDFADPALTPDITEYLHSFEWLRDLAAAATRERGSGIAEKVMAKWLAAHGAQPVYPAWRPDLWGRRILFWTAYAPYILSNPDPAYRAAILKTLGRGIRHLRRIARRAPYGLKRISAFSGLVASSLVVEGAPAGLRSAEAGLMRALSSGLHDDGGLVSRSPAEQVALVEILSQLRGFYSAARTEMPEAVAEAIEGSLACLLAVTLGDDRLSSWQAGNMGSKRRVVAAIEASGMYGQPGRPTRGWGYQRMCSRKSIIIFDAAPPPASRAFAGGCASTLAWEMSDGGHRLVVNCGGVAGRADALPNELVQALRTTAAHSTLTLGDRNSTAIHADGALGKGVTEVELSREEAAGTIIVEASHDGYAKRYGLIHQRQLSLSGDGGELRGEDSLVPAEGKRKSEEVGFAIRFHLAPGVEAAATADGQGALLRIKGGGVWQFRCRGGTFAMEDSLWVDGDAVPHDTVQLVVTGEGPPDGTTISWLFRRAG